MNSSPQVPFGLWKSPLTPRSLAGGMRLSGIGWDSDGKTLVWLEGRSAQGVLVTADVSSGDAPRDLTSDLSVRARVGYGGGDFTVAQGYVYFAEAGSGRLYRQALAGGTATPITPAFGHTAAPAVSPDGQYLVYVHSDEGVDRLALVDTAGRHWPLRLAEGHDFYMQPVWHPTGRQIAYLAWDHPLMPWDGTLLYLAELDTAGPLPRIRSQQLIAGDQDTAIFQPAFSPDGRWLAYISDASGWGQIYLRDLANDEVRRLTNDEVEYGTPAWVQGLVTFGWSPDSRAIYALPNDRAINRLIRLPIDGSAPEVVAGLEAYTWYESIAVSPVAEQVALIASASRQPTRLLLHSAAESRIMRRTTAEVVAPEQLAAARPVSWRSAGDAEVHGLLYLPVGFAPGRQPPPPAIVHIHGGPTSQVGSGYNSRVQFFTTRGYAFLDVNYRGSTGYGREYMLALRNNWGVCDIEDSIAAARYLAAEGLADAGRIVIMGGSSGGFTVLEAMCQAPGLFRAGLALYAVTNMFGLAADTHKFEERYLDSLLGPLPEAAAIYRERSPIFHIDRLQDPIALFQGADDTVVPRAQSDAIAASLHRRGIPHEYHIYEGEGHGWRKTETIEQFYSAIDKFLRQYVLFA